jgi:hypothetical protein
MFGAIIPEASGELSNSSWLSLASLILAHVAFWEECGLFIVQQLQ